MVGRLLIRNPVERWANGIAASLPPGAKDAGLTQRSPLKEAKSDAA